MLFTSMFTGVTVIWDREFGFLKEIMVAPVSRLSVFVGKMIGNATDAVVQAIITYLLGFLIGVPISALTFLITLPLMIFIALGLVCIGLVIASFMGSLESFGVIQSFVSLPLFFLSGALFPLTTAPAWIQAIGWCNPLTYGVDILRWAILGSAWTTLIPIGYEVLIVAGFDLGLMLLGTWSFGRRK
jgi:ABC-2 type transport system permease protein